MTRSTESKTFVHVTVEFFGIPRARAGVAQTTAAGNTLGDCLADLATRYPALADACIDRRSLKPGYTANIGGERFVTQPDTPLHEGDAILIMSLDAGG